MAYIILTLPYIIDCTISLFLLVQCFISLLVTALASVESSSYIVSELLDHRDHSLSSSGA